MQLCDRTQAQEEEEEESHIFTSSMRGAKQEAEGAGEHVAEDEELCVWTALHEGSMRL